MCGACRVEAHERTITPRALQPPVPASTLAPHHLHQTQPARTATSAPCGPHTHMHHNARRPQQQRYQSTHDDPQVNTCTKQSANGAHSPSIADNEGTTDTVESPPPPPGPPHDSQHWQRSLSSKHILGSKLGPKPSQGLALHPYYVYPWSRCRLCTPAPSGCDGCTL
jgi:hypothetical protein